MVPQLTRPPRLVAALRASWSAASAYLSASRPCTDVAALLVKRSPSEPSLGSALTDTSSLASAILSRSRTVLRYCSAVSRRMPEAATSRPPPGITGVGFVDGGAPVPGGVPAAVSGRVDGPGAAGLLPSVTPPMQPRPARPALMARDKDRNRPARKGGVVRGFMSGSSGVSPRIERVENYNKSDPRRDMQLKNVCLVYVHVISGEQDIPRGLSATPPAGTRPAREAAHCC